MRAPVKTAPRRWLLALWLLVLASAVAVVYTSHQSRQLYGELSQLQREENRLQVEWGQYLLEESSWASLGRIERIAKDELDMHVPAIEDVVMVKP